MAVRRRGWQGRVISSKTDGRKEGMTGSDGVRRSGASGDGDGDSDGWHLLVRGW